MGVNHPMKDDVVVRERRGNPHTVYVLGTATAPDQLSVRTREEAVTHAVAFAMRQHVRAWFDDGDNTLLLRTPFRPTA